ncbi:RNA recognition motif domain-containing protein [Ditylenchus destructor]|nr:RNA recognition motif domain-containing protein [Ditylenchus destructor]
MDPQSLFRIVSRSWLLQMCLRNVSISRRHLCMLRSAQISIQTTRSTSHAPNSRLNNQEMTMRHFSSYVRPPTEFTSKQSNKSSFDVSQNYSDEYIFSSNRHHDNNRTIFVGGLSKFTTVQSLYKYFLRFGTITGCKLARDKLTGSSKEYGFVEFDSVEQAENTIEFYPHVIDDQEVNVRMGSMKGMQQKFRLFVGGLSKETSVETLREYFSRFGDIAECVIPRDEMNGSRGFGYVTFKSQDVINNVLKSTPHCIDNKKVDVAQTAVRQREFTIIVKKLSPNTTNESLREYYSRFGELTQCDVIFDRQTGQSRGFGFVAFSSKKELDSAIEVNPHIIDDVKVELEYVTSQFDIIVTSLTSNITEKALNDYFSRYGKLRRCEIKESLPAIAMDNNGTAREELVPPNPKVRSAEMDDDDDVMEEEEVPTTGSSVAMKAAINAQSYLVSLSCEVFN